MQLTPPPKPRPQGLPLLDVNSLIHGDVGHPLAWGRLEAQGSNHCTARRYAGADASGNHGLVELNSDRDAVGLGRRGTVLLMPDDCTAGTFQVAIARRSDFPGGTKCRIVLLASDGTTVVTSLLVTPNLTADLYSVPASGLTAAGIYYLAIELNNSPTTDSQVAVLVGRASFTPTYASAPDGTKVFHRPFVRIPVFHETAKGNCEIANLPNSPRLSSLAYVEAETLPGHAAVIYDNQTTPSNEDQIAVLIGDGAQGGPVIVPSGSSGQLKQANFDVGGSGRQRIQVVRGCTQNTTPGAGAATLIGVWLHAIYLPATATLIPPGQGGRRLVVYGDSRAIGGGGAGTVVPGLNSWLALLRRDYPGEVIAFAHDGRSLIEDASTALKRAQLVETILRTHPSDVILGIGVNDYLQSNWSAPIFQTVIGPLMDDLRFNVPGKILATTPERLISPAVETANSQGSTLDAYRTAITTEAAARPWVSSLDLKTMFASNDTLHYVSDGVHENALGSAVKEQTILAALQTPIAQASAVPSAAFMLFSGCLQGDSTGTEKKRFFANPGVITGQDNGSTDRPGFPLAGPGGSTRIIRNVHINVVRNSMAQNHAIAVWKNGSESALLGVITPGSTGKSTLTGSLSVSENDTIDVGVRGTTGGTGNELAFTLMMEIAN